MNALAVSPDGTVVAATTTITARAWEMATGIPEVAIDGGHDHLEAVAFDLTGHSSWINALAYAPSGTGIMAWPG